MAAAVAQQLVQRREQARLVVDPFIGLGSTAVACAQLGIDFVGIELDPDYMDEAIERVRALK